MSPTADDQEPLEDDSPIVSYAGDLPRPVRDVPRRYSGSPPHRDRADRQLQWGALLAAAAAGFLIAMFGPCQRIDRQQKGREEELANLQTELQSARDRIAELESGTSTPRESSGEAAEPERASEPEPEAAVAKPEAAKEMEPPAARTPAPISSPPPEPSRIHQLELAQPQQVAAVSVFDLPDSAGPAIRATSRSGTPDLALLQTLTPEKAGWTMEAQPTLYWHASKGTRFPCEFKLVREGQDEPLVRVQLPAPGAAGIQRIELSEFGISLDEGASYRWSVSLVDLENSGDDRASGGIRRVAPPGTVRATTDAASASEQLDALERAGLWYDAFDLVTRWIDRNPGAKNLVARRNAMLERVGIQLSRK